MTSLNGTYSDGNDKWTHIHMCSKCLEKGDPINICVPRIGEISPEGMHAFPPLISTVLPSIGRHNNSRIFQRATFYLNKILPLPLPIVWMSACVWCFGKLSKACYEVRLCKYFKIIYKLIWNWETLLMQHKALFFSSFHLHYRFVIFPRGTIHEGASRKAR